MGVAIAGIMVPIIMFICIAVVVIALIAFRNQERLKLYDTLKFLADKEGPMQAELIASLNKQATPVPQRDLRRGVVAIGVAVGFIALAMFADFEDHDIVWPLIGIAFFPLAVGIGLIVLWRLSPRNVE